MSETERDRALAQIARLEERIATQRDTIDRMLAHLRSHCPAMKPAPDNAPCPFLLSSTGNPTT